MTHHQLDDHQMVMSQYYPAIYNQLVPDQGEGQPWRRRKKNKGETSSSGVMRKRKLSKEQVNLLERSFGDAHKLDMERKAKLASELGLDPQQVAVWFQNRRARWKNKKLKDEYSKLKSHHQNAIVENCRLETEIEKIKEQLCEREKEIQSLLVERDCARVSSNNNTTSTSSIFSMEQTHFLGEFGMEEILMDNNVFFVADQSTYITGMFDAQNIS
ncbi:homeobox-leucine zipper protein ATHB-40-like [Solanum dulcamara]|uniref:homeobox-leucine zipper protein ATHB-40-like n=1 Tax=Solanum dulcamara TaxID=45834 RepID=UPI0024854A70|nr:homeobox-leucine zipper protein ATHB-40-like [Solanum dulcamara]